MAAFSLADLFSEKNLALDLQGATSGEAIWEIVECLRAGGELEQAERFYELVMEREQKSSTVANGGVAFPHARTDLVGKIVLGIGRSKTGVNFPGRADLVHLIFLIGVPQQMVNDYLICVGALARLLKSEERRKALLDASTPAEFFDRLRSES
ncbi:MAG TPA: PTS sugar transporter subunit IIA [Chthoniobacterales bacterium]|jgi:mannitol/fructose-specific phosphotransferase system IIA component (Ntr-type)